MTKRIVSLLLAAVIAAMLVPSFAGAEWIMYVYTDDGKTLNVRSDPSVGNNLLGRLDYGSAVSVRMTSANGWACIDYNAPANGNVAYVQTRFLVSSKPGKYEITERDDNFRAVTPYMVTTVALNNKSDRSVGLRVKPNKTASAIRRLSAGEQLQVVAVAKTWSKVYDPFTGRYGYVANDYIFRG